MQDETLMYESAFGPMSVFYNGYSYGLKDQGLYLKSGYEKKGKRKGYYSDGEDAIVMIYEKGDEHYEQVYIGNRE